MAPAAGPPGIAPRLLAEGDHQDVLAARSGTEPLVAASSVGDDGLLYTRVWDLATGTVIGPPVRGDVDGGDGTFGVVPTADGDRPVLVLRRERGMCVFDARTGAQVAACEATHPIPELVCLAELAGRTVVASVRYLPDAYAPCEVWDARSGHRLQEFTVWYPHYHAIGDPLLLAGPELGDGAVLLSTQEERVDDAGWPPYAYDHAYLVLIDLVTGRELGRFAGRPPAALHTTAAGPVLVAKSPDGLATTAVRWPGGEHLTTFAGDESSRLGGLSVGSSRGRDILAGCDWHESATVWDLTRPEPLARIELPAPQGAAVARNGDLVIATAHGLFAVDAEALPAG